MKASVAIFSREGEAVVLVPEDEAGRARQASDARVVPYPGTTLRTLRSPMEGVEDVLLRTLRELGLAHGRLGIEAMPSLEPVGYLAAMLIGRALVDLLRGRLPAAVPAGADELFADLKAVMSAGELLQLRLACRAACDVFAGADELLQPGAREDEIAAELTRRFVTAPVTRSGTAGGGSFFCMSGPHAALAAASFATTRRRVLEPGDLVMIHANTSTDGLWTDITRTYSVGEERAQAAAMRRAIADAHAAGLAAIRPGVPAAVVDRAVRSALGAHGFDDDDFPHGAGHGVGFESTSGNARPRIHPASPDTLRASMTFNVEPAIYRKGFGGMRHCDMVAVTSDGVEVLTGIAAAR